MRKKQGKEDQISGVRAKQEGRREGGRERKK